MSRIENYVAAIRASLKDPAAPRVIQLCAPSGFGKTAVARSFVETYGGYYFSFRHMEASLAPKLFRPGCANWENFFSGFQATKNRPVIFFDDMDDRNDKIEFLNALRKHLEHISVVLIYGIPTMVPFPCTVIELKPMIVPQVLNSIPGISQVDALRLTAVTNGIPSLIAQFNANLSFEDNLRLFFQPGSVFLGYAENQFRQAFRSPESYNTLLYAMATRHNRISQIAAFSGYPKNKCDKYIKALDAAGFIEQRTQRDQAGTLRTHYYPKGGYYRTWYELYFPRQGDFDDPITDEIMSELLNRIDQISTIPYFKRVCMRYIRKSEWELFRHDMLMLDDPANYDSVLNGCLFDYSQTNAGQSIFVKIWDSVTDSMPKKEFDKIDVATVKERPFYENIYVLFSISRFTNFYEEINGKYANVHAVTLKMLLQKKTQHVFDLR